MVGLVGVGVGVGDKRRLRGCRVAAAAHLTAGRRGRGGAGAAARGELWGRGGSAGG